MIPKSIRTLLIEIIKALHGPMCLSVPTPLETNYCFPYVSHSETKELNLCSDLLDESSLLVGTSDSEISVALTIPLENPVVGYINSAV